MLFSNYLKLTRRLMNDQNFVQVNEFDLKDYLNIARRQVAIDAECVRGSGTATIGGGVVIMPITQFSLGLPGVSQAIVIRNARLNGQRVDIRPWDWFENYYLFGPPSSVLPEVVMAHQGQGTFSTLYIYSPAGGNLLGDLVFLPVDLIDDTTPDAIPYPWVDGAVFYAIWYAYMAMQRQEEAQLSLARYADVLRRGRATVTSTALPENDPGGLGALLATTMTPLGASPPRVPQQQGGG